jgi:cellobiose phosphorylase
MTTTENERAGQVLPTRGTDPETAAATPSPQVALLSNGSYGVVITDAGAGVSTWRDLDVTRWREDATRDCWGQFVYVRSPQDGRIWSIGRQPMPQGVDADRPSGGTAGEPSTRRR